VDYEGYSDLIVMFVELYGESCLGIEGKNILITEPEIQKLLKFLSRYYKRLLGHHKKIITKLEKQTSINNKLLLN